LALVGLAFILFWWPSWYYFVLTEGVKNVRDGRGAYYNPIAFAKMVAKLDAAWKLRLERLPPWFAVRLRDLEAEVERYEAWLLAKDRASYDCWRAWRLKHGH
jgi:hypothetical protein